MTPTCVSFQLVFHPNFCFTPTSVSPQLVLQGKPSQKPRKSKKKEKAKTVMSLGQFTTAGGERDDGDLEPTYVPPKSSMGLDDFGDYE